MLPDLTVFGIPFETTSADTYICSRIHLKDGKSYGREIDYDVPIFNGVFLQRPLVWTPFQKSEWIWSILIGRPLPPVAIHKTDTHFEVIDGKQRLHTIGEFLREEIPIFYENSEFYFSELPHSYQDKILHNRPVLGYLSYDLTDYQKLQWFRYINYAGTAQDKEHIDTLETLLQSEPTNGN